MEYHKINGIFKRYQKGDEIPAGKKKGDFIFGQYSKEEFKVLQDHLWLWYEKLDGMNCRIIIDPKNKIIELRGKTDRAQIPQQLQLWFDTWADLYRVNLFEQFPDGAILYGEGVGPSIQKGKHKFTQYEVILFDVFINNVFLKKEVVEEIAKQFNLRYAPFVIEATLVEMVRAYNQYYNKQSKTSPYPQVNRPFFKSTFGDFEMEGVVGIPKGDLRDRLGNRIVIKIKAKDFAA